MKFGKFAGALLLSGFGLTAVAQQPQAPAGNTQTRGGNSTQQGTPQQQGLQQQGLQQQGSQQSSAKATDDMLAHCLIIDNQAEIALARMAEGKAKNEEVKKLASMLQKDHQGVVQKLQTFSPNTRGDLLQSSNNAAGQDANRGSTGNPNERTNLKPGSSANPTQPNQQSGNAQGTSSQFQQGAGGTSTQSDRGLSFNQIHQELAQQCLSDAQTKLSKESGDEFDKCFVGMQIAAHAAMISKLTVFERHASSELKQVINDGKQSAKKHMDEAESLMDKLAGDSDKSGRKDSSNKDQDRSTNKDR